MRNEEHNYDNCCEYDHDHDHEDEHEHEHDHHDQHAAKQLQPAFPIRSFKQVFHKRETPQRRG